MVHNLLVWVALYPDSENHAVTTITVEVSDGDAEATEAFVLTVDAVDREAPTVKSFFPTGRKVSPKTKVMATFSEPMDVSALRDQDGKSTTFVLSRKGVQVPATVHYDEANDTAILTPSTKLKRAATHVATVKTGRTTWRATLSRTRRRGASG
ncbi:MAG: Ig-like domain-containing protein [Actinomycetota bacterium]|nr:Ig-like domain-containing protein [Actinomycetota bacterium]